MYVYREDTSILSLFKNGRGRVRMGVQVDGMDSGKLFTLSGKAILKPTESGTGTTALPYKTREVAVEDAFVYKRGKKVYFTSPEDMVIGTKCDLIVREMEERERVCRHVATTTKTTTRLNDKAMNYDDEKKERGEETLPPGEPNKFYLDYLQRSKLEGESENKDTFKNMDNDSGIGTASQVTSTDRLTPFSDTTLFSGVGAASSYVVLEEERQGDELLSSLIAELPDEPTREDNVKSVIAKKKSKKSKKGKVGDKDNKKDLGENEASKRKKKTKSTKKSNKDMSNSKSPSKKQGKRSKSKKKEVENSLSNEESEPCHGDSIGQADLKTRSYTDAECRRIQAENDRLKLEAERKQKLLSQEEARRQRKEHNKEMRKDLASLQIGQDITRPWTFSYFKFIPPARKNTKEAKKSTKQRLATAKQANS